MSFVIKMEGLYTLYAHVYIYVHIHIKYVCIHVVEVH